MIADTHLINVLPHPAQRTTACLIACLRMFTTDLPNRITFSFKRSCTSGAILPEHIMKTTRLKIKPIFCQTFDSRPKNKKKEKISTTGGIRAWITEIDSVSVETATYVGRGRNQAPDGVGVDGRSVFLLFIPYKASCRSAVVWRRPRRVGDKKGL